MAKATRNESGLVQWPTVRLDELREIERRREAAGVLPPDTSDQTLHDIAGDLVGLAFSGGGIRSASFNLGLLQALQEKGVLRHVDFLSTVSGGGYIGCHLSSLVLREDTSMEQGKFPLQEEPGGKQPARVVQFLRNGRYMVAHPLRFTGAYLVGTLLNNVVVLSGILAICTLLALLWRCCDVPVVVDWIEFATSGRATDFHRAFIPAAVFGLLWLVTRIYTSYTAKGRSLVPTVFFAGFVVFILVSIAVLLGNGDINGIEVVHKQWGGVIWVLAGVLLVGLIPTMRPWRLLQSGVSVNKKSDQLIFKITSTALLVGVPLAVVYYVGREDCSGFGATRTELTVKDIHDWSIVAELETPSERAARDADSKLISEQQAMSLLFMRSMLPNPALLPSESTTRFGKSQDQHLSTLADRPAVDLSDVKFACLRESLATDLIQQAIEFKESMNQNELEERPINVLRWNLLYLKNIEPFVAGINDGQLGSDDSTSQLVKQLQIATNQKAIQEEFVKRLNAWMSSQTTQQSATEDVLSWRFWNDLEAKEERLDDDAMLPRFERNVNEAILAYGRLTSRQKQWLDDTATAIDAQRTGGNAAVVSDPDKQEFARLYLEAKYPEKIFNRRRSLRSVSITADQWWRMKVFIVSLAVFIVSLLWIDPNWTSVHNYYRRQLAEAYIEPVNGFGREIPLCRMDTVAHGAPYHIINTAMNLVGKRLPESVDATRTFIFTRKYCGSDATDYCPTDGYLEGKYDLANAMAISGGALSPSQSQNPLALALMMILNLRLGQWLPNPRMKAAWQRPTYWHICKDLHRPAEERAFCFLSDGGHRENLGLAPLLRRRCKLIIVSDAGYDPDHTFADFLKVYRTARSRYGTQLFDLVSKRSISLTDLQLKLDNLQDANRNAGYRLGVTQRYFLAVGIRYHRPCTVVNDKGGRLPEPETGVLIYVKPSMIGKEEVDLLQHRMENPMFPHNPTSEVAYDEQQFESYRQLGHHIGIVMCDAVSGDELWNLNSGNRCERLTSLLTFRAPTPRDFGLWAEHNRFAAGNFPYALKAMASGDDEVVVAITKWAAQSDDIDKSSGAEWCKAVEKILGDKKDSWSSNTRAAITEMLDSFRHEDKAHHPGRKSSPSKR